MKCIKCGSEETMKNGHHHERQRFKCKNCGYQFTKEHSASKSPRTKCLAIMLFHSGLSLRSIASIVHVSAPCVLNWVREFSVTGYKKPKPQGSILVTLDEMWQFLHSKKANSGHEKHFVVLQVDSLTGEVELVVMSKSHGVE